MNASGLIRTSVFPRILGIRLKDRNVMLHALMECARYIMFRSDQGIVNEQFWVSGVKRVNGV
jgi:hypothetical protein